ncbi:MAG: hypothetical protein ACI4P8_07630 [Akkermansia sp.]
MLPVLFSVSAFVAALLVGCGLGAVFCVAIGALREGVTAMLWFEGLASALMPVAAGLALWLLSVFVRMYAERHNRQEQEEPTPGLSVPPASPKLPRGAARTPQEDDGTPVYFPVREDTRPSAEAPDAPTPDEEQVPQPKTHFFKLN